MLETKNMTIAEYVQRVAIPQKKFHFHKTKDDLGRSKLTGYVPKVGQLAVLLDFMAVAKVLRNPNSAKDFVIEYEDGTKERKNLINNDIEGYLDVE